MYAVVTVCCLWSWVMEIRITIGELIQYGIWKKTCEFMELDDEGTFEAEEEIRLTKEQAVFLGLIIVPLEEQDDDESQDETFDEDCVDDVCELGECSEVHVTFLHDIEIDVFARFTDSGEPHNEKRAITKGSRLKVTILDQDDDTYDLLFDDGYGSFDIRKEVLEVED
jgi:hypothetical protein